MADESGTRRWSRIAAFACAIFLASPAPAPPPPPPPPPVAPEVQAAADAFAAALPIEAMLRDRLDFAGAGWSQMGYHIAEILLQAHMRRWPGGCDRAVLTNHLARRVSPRLPAMLPQVARYVRGNISMAFRYRLTAADLVEVRAMIERRSGQAVLNFFWGEDLWRNPMVATPFIGLVNSDYDAMIAAATADCQADQRSPRRSPR